VLDDELISLKAVDIEVKMLSSRKSGKEGSTVDVLCDSFFQVKHRREMSRSCCLPFLEPIIPMIAHMVQFLHVTEAMGSYL